ncbi:hypothetical protein V2J09_013793 [Rumex salicifolius]
MPYLVRENLFIGDIGDAAKVLEKGASEITHILSVLSSSSISFFREWRSTLSIPATEIRKVYFEESKEDDDGSEEDSAPSSSEKLLYSLEYAGKELKVTRMAVPVMDVERENLLDYLDVCLDFIDESRKQGSVLVHCFAGVSRSAAVTTAYLMRSEHLSCEDALESLKQSCKFVCPNDGFLHQLKMFEEMGFKVDHAREAYNRGEIIDSSKFGADPALPKQVISPKIEASTANNLHSSSMYRCKKCRRLVASQANVVEHTPGGGETSFGWHKRKGGKPSHKPDEVECSSIFVEPLRWMKTVEEGLMEGKLSCVNCDARLGYFNWSGIQCSCGSWITPAFQLHKSRVDISTL